MKFSLTIRGNTLSIAIGRNTHGMMAASFVWDAFSRSCVGIIGFQPVKEVLFVFSGQKKSYCRLLRYGVRPWAWEAYRPR